MEELVESKVKKRGRKPKNERVEYELNREKTKFFVDVSKDLISQEVIFNLLEKVNKKDHGREIIFKDIVIYSLGKLVDKDVEKIQEVNRPADA